MAVQVVKIRVQQTRCQARQGGAEISFRPRAFRRQTGIISRQDQLEEFSGGITGDENNSGEKAAVQIGPEYRGQGKQG